MLSIGNIWTPDILDFVVDKEPDLADVQFRTPDEIFDDKINFWTKQVSTDIIPFATDYMGNIFSFLASDLKQKTETADIYFLYLQTLHRFPESALKCATTRDDPA